MYNVVHHSAQFLAQFSTALCSGRAQTLVSIVSAQFLAQFSTALCNGRAQTVASAQFLAQFSMPEAPDR